MVTIKVEFIPTGGCPDMLHTFLSAMLSEENRIISEHLKLSAEEAECGVSACRQIQKNIPDGYEACVHVNGHPVMGYRVQKDLANWSSSVTIIPREEIRMWHSYEFVEAADHTKEGMDNAKA